MDAARTLGEVIRFRRLGLGLTQEELAERIGGGVRQAEVSRLECDRVTLPRRQRLERIAAALAMPVGELLAAAGWSGADGAFRPPVPATTAPASPSEPESDRAYQEPPALADLRRALIRSQELHWHTVQLLGASHDLAASWDAGRIGRLRPRPTVGAR